MRELILSQRERDEHDWQSNLRAINTAFDNVTSIFDAAIKREREKRKVVPIKPDRDPPPRAAA